MTSYYIFKYLHIFGVVLLLGNVTVTAVWKVFADRSKDWRIIAFGQAMVTGTDFGLTIPGIILTMVGGYGLIWVAEFSLLEPDWLLWSQLMFIAAGVIWLGILVPVQIKQARLARAFAGEESLTPEYRRLSRIWITWGLISFVPLMIAMYLMIAKPG
ncbi:DUF2269 family protein [Alterisphingorhabdus coralli]|uniref:DUF2269 domain-containing protein n=1 Tax=Alterisphingorhabdus coralli TaxID=3071408 RepID=A0AA97FAH9_9SPHN|nr:DUF2269 domain-containing protein [Parasphingorhabdus sp. SCSIO 66989]WOE76032.1 DUF2269 domain-containing protein [Parasphingorhabdus sp. SCSIO 66989]